MSVSLAPVGGWSIVGLAAAMLFAVWIWAPARLQTTLFRRRVLAGLRLLTVLLMLLALLRPTVVYTQIRPQSANLVLLLDRSRSMQVGDAVANTSRWQALTSAVDRASPELSALAQDYAIKPYAFSDVSEPLKFDGKRVQLEEIEPEGRETAIGQAIEDLLERESGQRLSAVILLSDGAQRASAQRDTPPQTAARRLRDLGYPLYTFCLGQSRAVGEARDVALRELLLPSQTVFVKNRLTVRGALQATGFDGQELPVQLLFEGSDGQMEVVDATTVRPAGAGQTLNVELGYVPQIPGEYKVTLRAVEQPGELVKSNNELSTFVTVRKGGLNVLYLEGALRVEQRFVWRALDRSANIKVDYVFLDAANRDKRPTDLLARFAPGKYDVFILGDVDSTLFEPDELTALSERVEQGAGLLMMGGLQTFGAGGYQKTPLAEILPIEMDPIERQTPGEPIRTDLHLEGEILVRPTVQGSKHFVMLLATPEQNAAFWESLPPLEGANRFRGLKPSANLLAESSKGEPLLVAQDVGRGRVVAWAGDSTWRWALGGQKGAQQRFWRQLVLWLAHKEQGNEGEIWVELDPRRYDPGRRVEFTCGARNAQGDSITDATWSAEITLPDGAKRAVRLGRDQEQQRGTFTETNLPGDYRLTVTATRDGQPLGTAQARFLVFEQALELDNPVADPALLESLASMTEGESFPPEQLSELLDRLRRQPPRLEIERQTKQALVDTWPFFGLLVGVLCGEWFLRKRWGLV
jgi:uncharacterized membrane protein